MRIVFNSSQETLFQSEVSLKDLSSTMAGLFNAVVSAGKFVYLDKVSNTITY